MSICSACGKKYEYKNKVWVRPDGTQGCCHDEECGGTKIKSFTDHKIDNMTEVLERHHRGNLPKSYYTNDGKLTPKSSGI